MKTQKCITSDHKCCSGNNTMTEKCVEEFGELVSCVPAQKTAPVLLANGW